MTDFSTPRPNASQPQTLDGEAFLALLGGQLKLYRQLGELVARQRELISAEDPAELLAVLAERQRLTNRLTKLTRETGSLQKCWNDLRQSMAPAQRSRAEQMLREMRRQVATIAAADDEDTKRLEVRKQRVAAELRSIPARGAMQSVYGRGNTAMVRTFDRTDESP